MNNPMQTLRLTRSFVSKRTIFSFARKSPWHLPCNCGPLIPNRELVDEEVCPGYDSRVFYPARAGEVLAHRYQLLSKIGWGSQSTVWLARDVSRYPSRLMLALRGAMVDIELMLFATLKVQMGA